MRVLEQPLYRNQLINQWDWNLQEILYCSLSWTGFTKCYGDECKTGLKYQARLQEYKEMARQARLFFHIQGIVKSVEVLSIRFQKSQSNVPNINLLWKHRSEKQDKKKPSKLFLYSRFLEKKYLIFLAFHWKVKAILSLVFFSLFALYDYYHLYIFTIYQCFEVNYWLHTIIVILQTDIFEDFFLFSVRARLLTAMGKRVLDSLCWFFQSAH